MEFVGQRKLRRRGKTDFGRVVSGICWESWGRYNGRGRSNGVANLGFWDDDFGNHDFGRRADGGNVDAAYFDFWAVDLRCACGWWACLWALDLRNEAIRDNDGI